MKINNSKTPKMTPNYLMYRISPLMNLSNMGIPHLMHLKLISNENNQSIGPP